jgi:hypothetical protein
MLAAGFTGNARAANCAPATSAGTAPADWGTYCWLDFSPYDDALARGGGQTFTFTLPDRSTLSFVATVTAPSTSTLKAVAAPSWTGAAVGITAFLGIPGKPILYTANAGNVTITFSGIRPHAAPGASAAARRIASSPPMASPPTRASRWLHDQRRQLEVQVAGHADLTAHSRYNLRQSARRARTVTGELVRLGVPAAAIATTAVGSSEDVMACPGPGKVAERRRYLACLEPNRRVVVHIDGP